MQVLENLKICWWLSFFKKISLFRTKTSFLLFSGGYPCVILSTIKISLALTSLLVSSKEPMVVWLGKKDPWPLIVSTFPMAVFLIRAVSGAISSHPFHSVGKQRLFYKHFLSIFNVLGLGQDVGDPFMSKKWALSWRSYQCRRGAWYVNGKYNERYLSWQERSPIECCGNKQNQWSAPGLGGGWEIMEDCCSEVLQRKWVSGRTRKSVLDSVRKSISAGREGIKSKRGAVLCNLDKLILSE